MSSGRSGSSGRSCKTDLLSGTQAGCLMAVSTFSLHCSRQRVGLLSIWCRYLDCPLIANVTSVLRCSVSLIFETVICSCPVLRCVQRALNSSCETGCTCPPWRTPGQPCSFSDDFNLFAHEIRSPASGLPTSPVRHDISESVPMLFCNKHWPARNDRRSHVSPTSTQPHGGLFPLKFFLGLGFGPST